MLAHFPAPELRQGADEDLLIKLGAIVYPGFVDREPNANGLRLTLAGDYRSDALVQTAADQFQVLLGVLRVWRPVAGQRADEVRPGIGHGPLRNEQGSQLGTIGPAIDYVTTGDEVGEYAVAARRAIDHSMYLRDALWLYGRRDRNAADLYMIEEYSEKEFGSRKATATSLNVSMKDIDMLRNSANNLAPTAGGRHATESRPGTWALPAQARFVATLVKSWIRHLA